MVPHEMTRNSAGSSCWSISERRPASQKTLRLSPVQIDLDIFATNEYRRQGKDPGVGAPGRRGVPLPPLTVHSGPSSAFYLGKVSSLLAPGWRRRGSSP